MTKPSSHVVLRYEVPRSSPDWTLPEEPVPETALHDEVIELLRSLLRAWIARAHLDAQVQRNLAVRWDPSRPKTGVDPDLCVIVPRTPEGDRLESLRTWVPGHAPPKLTIEVVSATNPHKDYVAAPAKYAALGVEELWIFDPLLAGPKHLDGPHRLQVFRSGDEAFERVYAGEGPAWSEALSAWLFAVHDGERLRIASDRDGTQWWETEAERERSEKERERAARLAAEAEAESLREQLRRARGGG